MPPSNKSWTFFIVTRSLQHPSGRSVLIGTPAKVLWGTLPWKALVSDMQKDHKEAKDKKPMKDKKRKDTQHDKAKKSKAVQGSRDFEGGGSGSVSMLLRSFS